MALQYSSVVIIAFVIGNVASDFYTSISSLEHVLEAEEHLIGNLENYIKELEESNAIIRKYVEKVEKIGKEIDEDRAEYFEDPLNTFQIIRRIVTDWKALELLIMSDTEIEAYNQNVTKMEVEVNVTKEDLAGASKAFVRLQNVYALETQEMAEGVLMDYEYDTVMSASDCFELGQHLYEAQEYRYALKWLTEARIRLQLEALDKDDSALEYVTEAQILEFLAPTYYQLGNPKMGLMLNDELLALEPDHELAIMNKERYQYKVMEQQNVFYSKPINQTKPERSEVQRLYEETCREELRQTPRQQRNLRCRYTSNNVPFGLLAPFQIEELNHDPAVTLYYNAIYPNEIQKIINTTEDMVERSKVGDITSAVYSEVRTSQNTWLWFEENPFLNNLAQRLLDMTGLSLESAEALQVANYGIAGHYGPHYDFSEDPEVAFQGKGNRILTALFYINDVELGGSTAFPFLHLAVPPIKGAAVLWHNLHESLEMDFRTKHAGCPVLKGSKWICNEWFHENKQEFKRPCGLKQDGFKSIKYKSII